MPQNQGEKGIQVLESKVLFGVVREDPQVEIDLITKFKLKSAVLIGSGGCTAFSLKAADPRLSLSLIEPNEAQVRLIKRKISILKKSNLAQSRLVVGGRKDPLIESGAFESLFKLFREFLFEFVISKKNLTSNLKSPSRSCWKSVFKNPYWATSFDLFFSDSLLVSMFGPEAVQYAPRNSYPTYFRELIERGLVRSDAENNYFLHHIFLGHYLSGSKNLPLYLQIKPRNLDMDFHNSFAHEFKSYKDFDLVSLSNILDWSSLDLVRKVGDCVAGQMSRGSILVFRQLNNGSDFKKMFKGFKWQTRLEKSALKSDRSLFYSSLCIGVKYE